MTCMVCMTCIVYIVWWCSACANCWYILAINAFTDSQYTITVSTKSPSLRIGVPLKESIVKGTYEFFKVSAPNLEALTVTVTDFGQGDPDLFVSTTNPFPNSTDYQWASRRVFDDRCDQPCVLMQSYLSCLVDVIEVQFVLIAM